MRRDDGAWGGVRLGPLRTPRVIKEIAMVTAAAFVLQFALSALLPRDEAARPLLVAFGGIRPSFFFRGMIWQPLTALLLHGELWHLLGNLFFLWMFGSPVAEVLGRRRFLQLYVGGGIAGGILGALVALAGQLLGLDWPVLGWDVPTIGASGAVFTVLAWYCLSWPDRPISLILLPLTLTARWMLPLEFLTEWSWSPGAVNHLAHLCGAAVGLLAWRIAAREPPLLSLAARWRAWRQKRSRRHLRVLRGGGADGDGDGPMVH